LSDKKVCKWSKLKKVMEDARKGKGKRYNDASSAFSAKSTFSGTSIILPTIWQAII